MDKFWERYIQSRPAPGESKGAFDAFAAAHRDPGPRTMAQEPRNMAQGGQLVQNTDDGSRPGYGGSRSGQKPGAGEITWADLKGDTLKNVKTWGKNRGWDLAETKKNYESSSKFKKSKIRVGTTTGEKRKSMFEILDKEQENWFRKHIFNNPEEKYHKVKWKDIKGGQKWKLIERQKKFVDQKAIRDDLAKKGYVLAGDWFEKQDISIDKLHTIRREYNTIGGSKKRWDIVKDGGELKVIKKQIGDTNYIYIKPPDKKRTAEIVELFNNPDPYIFDSTSNNIKRLLKPGSKYRTMLLSGDYPTVKNLPKWLKPNEAATAVYRIAQLLDGHKFDNFDPKIKIDTAASKRMFKKLDKEPWGKAYSSVPRKLNMQLIQNELGAGYFDNTYEGFVKKARNVLKKAGLPAGADINELTGLTSAANNKSFTSSQFVNLLPKEYNRIHHASMLKEYGRYEGALQTALKNGTVNFKDETLRPRQLVNSWEKWRGDWFERLPKEYKTKSISSTLPSFKLGENTAQTVLGNKRIKQLLNLGLEDITKDTGYFKTFGDIETMRKTPVLKEVAMGDEKAIGQILKTYQNAGIGKNCKAYGGRVDFQDAGAVGVSQCMNNAIQEHNKNLQSNDLTVRNKARSTQFNINKTKNMKSILSLGGKGVSKAVRFGKAWGVEWEPIIEGAFYEWARRKGYTHDKAKEETFFWKMLDPERQTGILEGAEPLLEKELYEIRGEDELVEFPSGKAVRSPEFGKVIGERGTVKRYIDNEKASMAARKKYNQLYSGHTIASTGRYRDPEKAEGYAKAMEKTWEEINSLEDKLDLDRDTYQAAVEKQQTEQGVRAIEYGEYGTGDTEKLVKQRERRRQKAMEDKFPTLSKYEINKKLESAGLYVDPKLRYKGQTVQRPKGLKLIPGWTIENVGDYFKDLDKSAYFAENFRMEKAGGGLTRTVAPDSGPMDQGLASTPEYDTYSKEYKWQT